MEMKTGKRYNTNTADDREIILLLHVHTATKAALKKDGPLHP